MSEGSSSNKWRFSSAHTRLRFQLVTTGAVLFLMGNFTVVNVDLPFNFLEFSHAKETNESSTFEKTAFAGLMIFWIATLINFILLSLNEKSSQRTGEQGVEEKISDLNLALRSVSTAIEQYPYTTLTSSGYSKSIHNFQNHKFDFQEHTEVLATEDQDKLNLLDEFLTDNQDIQSLSQTQIETMRDIVKRFSGGLKTLKNYTSNPLVEFISLRAAVNDEMNSAERRLARTDQEIKTGISQVKGMIEGDLADLKSSVKKLQTEYTRTDWTFTTDRILNSWFPVSISVALVLFGLFNYNPIEHLVK